MVGAPAESPAVSAELIVPSTIEQPPTVVKPPLTNGKVSVGVAPTTPSAAECLDAQAGSPNGHNKAMEFPQPAGWQIGGPQVSPKEELNACGESGCDIANATPHQDDDVSPGAVASMCVHHEVGEDEPHSMPPPLSPISEILKLMDDINELDAAPGHEIGEPAEMAKPEVAPLSPEAPAVAEPKVAALKGSAEFSAEAMAPASAPLATNAAPASKAPPMPSQPSMCPVLLQVLTLAEELRKPNAYCGYYVFVLFCLHYGVRINIWSGDQCLDVVEKHLPWAAERCQAKSHINAIFCSFSVHPETGVTTVRPATPEVPLDKLNHYVATISMRTSLTTLDVCTSSLETFYLPKGQCPLPTVAEGNCSLDVCVQSRGLPQTPGQFQSMRERLSEYLLANASNAHLISTLRDLGEITAEFIDASALAAAPMGMGPNDIVDLDPPCDDKGDVGTEAAGAIAEATAEVAKRDHSQVELDAVRWACGLTDRDSDLRATRSLMKELPDWAVQLQVVAYQARPPQLVEAHPPAPVCAPGRYAKRPYAASRLEYRIDEGKRMLSFLKKKSINPNGRWPARLVEEYLNQSAKTRDLFESRCRTYSRVSVLNHLRMFYHRAVKSLAAAEQTGGKADTGRKCTRGCGSFRKRFRSRYRWTGFQGRCRKAPEIRDALFEWWSTIRFSLHGQVMTRVTRSILNCKAKQLARDHMKACLKKGIRCDFPRIDSHWVTDWADEYNVCFRKPNRTYKVPDSVLKQRLRIFWENCMRVRRAAQLCLGYDLAMDNVDQSPFHKNEAGSKDVCTLSLRGASTVPLIEGHAATRSRWSANTTTQSDYGQTEPEEEHNCPPLECMFKADGHVLEAKLNKYIRGYGFNWLSVSTSPKATYREEHVVGFLRRHFQRGRDAKWRIMGLDMFGPQTTPNVFNCCWHQNQVLINQPGGGTGVTQTNDTDLHQGTKADYIHEEAELMMHLVRSTGKRCPTYTAEQCIDIFARIWHDPRRHVEAARGYWRTGTLNALDGSEDNLIVREARKYWDRLDMDRRRKQVIHDVEVEYAAKRLRWTPTHIKALILPYPKTGHMDVIKEFQDDEHPPLDDADDADDSDGVAQEDEDIDDKSDEVDEDAFNQDREVADEAANSFLGKGTAVDLTYDQAKTAGEIQDKLATYERARQMMESLGDRNSALALARTIHAEKRKARGRYQQDPAIAQALNEQLRDEFQEYARKRIEYNKERAGQDDAKKAKAEAQEVKRQVAATRAKLKQAKSLLDCTSALKRFSPKMLGDELSHGGPAKCRDLRFEVLDRLMAQGDSLSAQQQNDWQWFKREWDAAMAKEHDKQWGSVFAGMVQHLVDELETGTASAVADFMYNETVRVLSAVPTLLL